MGRPQPPIPGKVPGLQTVRLKIELGIGFETVQRWARGHGCMTVWETEATTASHPTYAFTGPQEATQSLLNSYYTRAYSYIGPPINPPRLRLKGKYRK